MSRSYADVTGRVRNSLSPLSHLLCPKDGERRDGAGVVSMGLGFVPVTWSQAGVQTVVGVVRVPSHFTVDMTDCSSGSMILDMTDGSSGSVVLTRLRRFDAHQQAYPVPWVEAMLLTSSSPDYQTFPVSTEDLKKFLWGSADESPPRGIAKIKSPLWAHVRGGRVYFQDHWRGCSEHDHPELEGGGALNLWIPPATFMPVNHTPAVNNGPRWNDRGTSFRSAKDFFDEHSTRWVADLGCFLEFWSALATSRSLVKGFAHQEERSHEAVLRLDTSWPVTYCGGEEEKEAC